MKEQTKDRKTRIPTPLFPAKNLPKLELGKSVPSDATVQHTEGIEQESAKTINISVESNRTTIATKGYEANEVESILQQSTSHMLRLYLIKGFLFLVRVGVIIFIWFQIKDSSVAQKIIEWLIP